MKKAERLALVGLVGLLVIVGVLLAGGVMYSMTVFWVGMMVAMGQALVVGLAMWGLKLARQREELKELTGNDGLNAGAGSEFRMSSGGDSGGTGTATDEEAAIQDIGDGVSAVDGGDFGVRAADYGERERIFDLYGLFVGAVESG